MAQEEHDTVKKLLDDGAEVDATDARGFTSLMFAAQLGNNRIAKLILEKAKASNLLNEVVNAVNEINDTALKWAAYYGRLLVTKTLLDYKADVSIMDTHGNTAIIDAAGQGHAKIVALLIEAKADINHENNRGQTALTVAKLNKHKEVITLLKEHNAQEGIADSNDTSILIGKIRTAAISSEEKKELWKMAVQLSETDIHPSERAIIRSCLDLALSLPWGIASADTLDLKHAQKILDEDHYGMHKVKEQILDFIATLSFNKTGKAPILCLVGPPGIGKTSIAKSIARALGRNYARLPVGGLHDESQLRGHVRTYIGARPGRIVLALKEAKSMNPVIVIDEIDKLGSQSHHGDPAAAMLEILDPEQNKTFRDNYLEMPLDLSRILFITTANSTEGIPAPLRDRMQIIYLPSYTQEEKIAIAEHHLIKQAIKEAGLEGKNIKISKAVLQKMIQDYALEAGVRQTKRNLARLMAKIARSLIEKGKIIEINPDELKKHLGADNRNHLLKETTQNNEIGMVNALAVLDGVGIGVMCKIETILIPKTNPNDGFLQFEYHALSDMIKKSFERAASYVRLHAKNLGIDPEQFKLNALHINYADKTFTDHDGPSAGIGHVTAIVSALTNRAVNCQYAMTGAINLRGQVLPIGGYKEKILAAKDNGMKYVILPYENKQDVEEMDDVETVTKGITVVYVKQVDEVLKLVLL